MKGLIFTEFLDMVEEKFSPEMVEDIIIDADLPHKGAYTQIGTYDHEEIIRLVVSLSKRVKLGIDELQKIFGEHLFSQFAIKYENLISDVPSAFDLINKVDSYIHVEVLKIYPDADLPRFTCNIISSEKMEMLYLSRHPFSDLAYGLIKGCSKHFNEKIDIHTEILPKTMDEKHQVLFTLTKQS